MEDLDIFAILTLAGLAFSHQPSAISHQRSAASSQELEVRSQEPGVRSQHSAFCLLLSAYSLLRGWQGEGYLPRSFYRAGALGTDNIIPYELTMSSKKFCP